MSSTNKLYSINVADRFNNAAGEEKTKFREIAVGFANKTGGLGFTLPKGVMLTGDAQVVIFPIEPKDDGND